MDISLAETSMTFTSKAEISFDVSVSKTVHFLPLLKLLNMAYHVLKTFLTAQLVYVYL